MDIFVWDPAGPSLPGSCWLSLDYRVSKFYMVEHSAIIWKGSHCICCAYHFRGHFLNHENRQTATV
jgi:hypothetical protein